MSVAYEMPLACDAARGGGRQRAAAARAAARRRPCDRRRAPGGGGRRRPPAARPAALEACATGEEAREGQEAGGRARGIAPPAGPRARQARPRSPAATREHAHALIALTHAGWRGGDGRAGAREWAAYAARHPLTPPPAMAAARRLASAALAAAGRLLAAPSVTAALAPRCAPRAAAPAAAAARSFAASALPPAEGMSMEPSTITVPTVDASTGAVVGTAALPADVFGAPVRPDILHRVVIWQQAKARAGTGAAKNRAAVRGGGRKPWKQKGTGRARAGSIRSPLWVGGGKAHPPVPRSFETGCNKRVRRLALAGALSARAAEGRLLVVEGGDLGADGKTVSKRSGGERAAAAVRRADADHPLVALCSKPCSPPSRPCSPPAPAPRSCWPMPTPLPARPRAATRAPSARRSRARPPRSPSSTPCRPPA